VRVRDVFSPGAEEFNASLACHAMTQRRFLKLTVEEFWGATAGPEGRRALGAGAIRDDVCVRGRGCERCGLPGVDFSELFIPWSADAWVAFGTPLHRSGMRCERLSGTTPSDGVAWFSHRRRPATSRSVIVVIHGEVFVGGSFPAGEPALPMWS
jgi:hypothetical protein